MWVVLTKPRVGNRMYYLAATKLFLVLGETCLNVEFKEYEQMYFCAIHLSGVSRNILFLFTGEHYSVPLSQCNTVYLFTHQRICDLFTVWANYKHSRCKHSCIEFYVNKRFPFSGGECLGMDQTACGVLTL